MMRVLVVMILLMASCTPRSSRKPNPTLPPVETLAKLLKSDNAQVRARAATVLGATRSAAAVEPLSAAVEDPDEHVRRAAVRACGVHGSPRLLPALKLALGDRARSVRLLAVRSLARLGTVEAAVAMVGTLDGSSQWLRPDVADALCALPPKVLATVESAIPVLVAELKPSNAKRFARLVRALRVLGEPALVALLQGIKVPRAQTPSAPCKQPRCRALVAMGPSIVPALLGFARSKNAGGVPGLQGRIAAVLGSMGAAAAPALLRQLGTRGGVGWLAQAALVKIGKPALPVLLRIAAKIGAKGRLHAIRILGALRAPGTVKLLLAALKETDAQVRLVTVRALGTLGDKGAVTALLSLCRSTGPTALRAEAIRSLGCLRDPRAYGVLAALTRGSSKPLRAPAVRALAALPSAAARALIRTLTKSRDKTLAAVAKTAPKVVSCRLTPCQNLCKKFIKCLKDLTGGKLRQSEQSMMRECRAECRKNVPKFRKGLNQICKP